MKLSRIVFLSVLLVAIGLAAEEAPSTTDEVKKAYSKEDTDLIPEEIISQEYRKSEFYQDTFVFRSNSDDQAIYLYLGTDFVRIYADIFRPSKRPGFGKEYPSAPAIDAKYFGTEKGIKLGMAYDEVIKIYGKPDKEETPKEETPKKDTSLSIWARILSIFGLSGPNAPSSQNAPSGPSRKTCSWEILGVEGIDGEVAPVSLVRHPEPGKQAFPIFSATIDFVNGKVERIQFGQYFPG